MTTQDAIVGAEVTLWVDTKRRIRPSELRRVRRAVEAVLDEKVDYNPMAAHYEADGNKTYLYAWNRR